MTLRRREPKGDEEQDEGRIGLKVDKKKTEKIRKKGRE